MASSGVIEKSFATYYRLRIEWSQSKDTTNNRSTINCNLYVVSTNSGWNIYSIARPVTWKIDGSGSSFTGNAVNNPGGQKSFLGSFSRTINHNSDGSKSAAIEASWSFNGTISGTYYGTITASGTANLDSIPRASQPSTSASNVNFGNSVTIYTNRASSSFTHTLKYSFAGYSGTIANGVTTSYSWTVPTSLASRIPNATSGSCTITCETYSGSTKIGTKSTSITLSVPSSAVPSFNTITHSENVSSVASIVGAYVQGLSKLNLAITGATGALGSTIKSYEITFDGSRYTFQSGVSSVIKGSGNLTITGKITDSRGRTASKSVTINVVPYTKPVINMLEVRRTTSAGVEDPLGTYAKIYLSGTFTSLVINSSQKNTLTWRIFSRQRGSSSWGSVIHSGTISSGTVFNPSIPIISGYDISKSYEIMVEVEDKFNKLSPTILLSSGETPFTISKVGVGIGKVWERGAADVKGDIYQEGTHYPTKIVLPSNKWFADGEYGIDMKNSDIIGLNNLVFADTTEGDGEGIQWLKSGRPAGSINKDDYDYFQIKDGVVILNGRPIAFDGLKTIWSGAYYMNGNQTLNLSSMPLANCPTGWMLLWGDYNYDTDSPGDYDYVYTPIYKSTAWGGHIANGKAHFFIIPSYLNATSKVFVIKRLNVSNTSLSGHNDNVSPNNDGLDVALRAVYAF